ncbi:hypothetical protein E4P41_13045 [Geodermatophilus sp. DF01-2]|uniref:hypothetical protein n=1 Tax=Geodermatophilus sp. DF01-2 TaxID=2559610 RepID=UPI001073C8D1|nr:hypothetical protein [Geodermatophilus sp. DF01_2]TFV58342.1 hypothetical protein E4P41_13045 [Geodermatophilus sp. DF01_2]
MRTPQNIDPARIPSLPIVETALVREEDSYRFRAQGMDTRLGLLLSAAGVLVALVGNRPSVAGLAGQVLALAAGATAVHGLWPRVDKGVAPRRLRDRYLAVDPTLTRMRLLNTRLDLHAQDEGRLLDKARRLRACALLLLAAATAVVMGRTVEEHDRPDGRIGVGESPDWDWDALYPPDPELMASAEGDAKGLAALKQAARERIEQLERA